MLNDLKLEFDSRISELDYFYTLIQEANSTLSKDKNLKVNMLKSCYILILYNIVEYVINFSIQVIEDRFKNYDFSRFNEDFQSIFIKTFWLYVTEVSLDTIQERIIDEELFVSRTHNCILSKWYHNSMFDIKDKCKIRAKKRDRKKFILSWNINYENIEIISRFFWFKVTPSKNINLTSADLLTFVRDKRNLLSHWNLSFNSTWKDITDDLNVLSKTILTFLNRYIKIVEKYLEEEPYLA